MKWNGRWMQCIRVILVEFILFNEHCVSDTIQGFKNTIHLILTFSNPQNSWLSFSQPLNVLRHEPTILPSVYTILSDIIWCVKWCYSDLWFQIIYLLTALNYVSPT